MKASTVRLLSAVVVFGAVAALLDPRPALAHPLHTSVAEITRNGRDGFTVSLRVFADDFLLHAGAPETAEAGGRPDAKIVSYLMRTFVIIDGTGRGLPLKWCGLRRVADLLVVCLSGTIPGGLRGARVRYSILTDVFSDQVNILQVSADSGKRSLLFTPGETTRQIR